ncbi:MAG TPA: HNH endonuclease [Terriglobales bacterium]|nr:HNH endonuclease [Terriglobales bacterium]
MVVKWLDERCIVCTLGPELRRLRSPKTAKLTKEHVIAEAVGGRLVCNFLCKACNDHLGVLEASLKTDARIRLAIENLKDVLPDLWRKMLEGQAYTARDAGGRFEATCKNGRILARSSKRQDGTLFRPTSEAWDGIEKKLLRNRSSKEAIAAAKRKFEELPEGVESEVVPGLSIIKGKPTPLYPSLQFAEIDVALTKTAYEYLTLRLGRSIFNKFFDPVRSSLLGDAIAPPCCAREERRQKDAGYRPFHRLTVDNTNKGLMVKILLFGYLSYRVEFRKVQMPRSAIGRYTLDLRSGEENWE